MKRAIIRNVTGLSGALLIVFAGMFLYGFISDSANTVSRVVYNLEQIATRAPLATVSAEKK